MNAKIDGVGFLWVERKGILRRQTCPFHKFADREESACGDWCPKFYEWEFTSGSLRSWIDRNCLCSAVICHRTPLYPTKGVNHGM